MLRWGVLVPLAGVRRVFPVPPRPAQVVVPRALRSQALFGDRPVLRRAVRSRVAALVLVSRTARRVRSPGLLLWAALF